MGSAVQTDKTLQEKALVELQNANFDGSGNGEGASFEATMQDISFPNGERPFSMEQLVSGGQERTYDPEETKTFSGTMYIKGVDPDEATGIEKWFLTGDVANSNASADAVSSLDREDLLVVVTVVDEDIADATSSTSEGNAAYRFVMQNAELISADTDFEDNVLTVEFEFEATAYTPAGETNVRRQSVRDGSTDTLDDIPAYGSGNFDITDPTFDTSDTA